MNLVREFTNGARIYDVDGTGLMQIGVAANGKVYWATPEGWDWVLDNARRDGYRVNGDSTGWPTVGDTDYYL